MTASDLSIAAGVERLRAAAAAFPESERPTFAEPAPADAVAAFERAVGTTLPSVLRELLARTEEIVAMDVHNGYWIGGPQWLTRSLLRGDHYPNAVDLRPVAGPTIPVGGDGGGNGFELAVADGRVWRWDHETGAARVVAPSLAAFLARVAEDWERASVGDARWSYLV